METLKVDLCVIGGGSGGLSVASGGAQMGASVVLIEKAEMGGDCLNTGCVPSKALLAAAKRAHAFSSAEPFGIANGEARVDWDKVRAHVKGVIDTIAPHDSVERFEGLGVKVIKAHGRFVGPSEVEAGGTRIKARRVVVATGSTAGVPPIPGLEQTPFLTNETVFTNPVQPEKLIVIGAGPIGLEMAQAHRRLGSEVVVLEAFKALGRDDPEMARIALDRLRAEDIDIREGVKISRVEAVDGRPAIRFENGEMLEGSHLLVAAGRKVNVEGLDLEAAGVDYDRRGISVDDRLRSVTNRKVFAIGDVAGGLQFTHVAGYHAGIVIRNALFRLPARTSTHHIPWVTYIDPEMAHVGLLEAQAREKFGERIRVLRWTYKENDRAIAERATNGMIKVITGAKGKILGCSVVGLNAGEVIQLWALAIANGMKIGAVAGYVSPYPTIGEVSKRAAGQYYVDKLFSGRTKSLVRMLAKLG